MRSQTIRLFAKRAGKYLAIFLIFTLSFVPLIKTSYSLARKSMIEKSAIRLSDGITQLNNRIRRSQEVGRYLSEEENFIRLQLINGIPRASAYHEINEAQDHLRKLCAAWEGVEMTFLVFRDNPVFLSNYFSADSLESFYPDMLSYDDMKPQEWREALFASQSVISILPSHRISSPYISPNPFNGLTVLIDNSRYHSIGASNILGIILRENEIFASMVYPDIQDDSLWVIKDFNENILASANYDGTQIAKETESIFSMAIQGEEYIMLSETDPYLGIKVLVGIPDHIFNMNTREMVKTALFYTLVGAIVIIGLSLFFSLRETFSIKNIMIAASHSSLACQQSGNEYNYIENTLHRMSTAHQEQQTRIEQLNASFRTCALENLFFMGAFTQQEENEIRQCFNSDFQSYCVAVIHLHEEESAAAFGNMQAIYQINDQLSSLLRNRIVSVNFSMNELVAIIFLDREDPDCTTALKEEIIGVIRSFSTLDACFPVITVGLSNACSGIKNIRNAFMQAKDALYYNRLSYRGGVHVYHTHHSATLGKSIDVAILSKCYDILISGDKAQAERLFDDISKSYENVTLCDLENQQLYYSLRLSLNNARLEIMAGSGQKDLLQCPNYNPMQTTNEMLDQLRNFAFALCDAVESNRRSKNIELQTDILQYIKDNFSNSNLSAATISSKYLLSEKYVFQLVKEASGKSLGKLIEELRVEYAEGLLRNTELPNSTISTMSGFGSENTFYRAFLRKHGVSPANWRKLK